MKTNLLLNKEENYVLKRFEGYLKPENMETHPSPQKH